MKTPGRLNLLRYEIIGILFIAVFGSFLHFAYDLSGSNILIAPIAAVNESVWEHLKLVFWPTTVYMVLQLVFMRNLPEKFIVAKTVGIFLMPMVIVVGYYLYTAFLEENLLIDIGLFFISITTGQITSYKLMQGTLSNNRLNALAVLAIVALAIVFIVFTFYTPRMDIFRDPLTGIYGLS
ncbi:MAG: DUF6512 family protein [Nitrososphaerota archaeon]